MSSSASAPHLRVRVRGLTRRFGQKVALHPFDLDVEAGSIMGLVGPNGSGKSTLLRCLTGLVRPDGGEAEVAGVRLAGDGTAIRRRCSYSPGELTLYGELRGGDHLTWLLRGRGAEARRRAEEIATDLGLPLGKRVRGYSHGMKRQLLFAASIAPRLPVRILDEITEGLDPAKRGEVLELMRADAAAGTTILLSSHHLGEVDRVCDRLVFLNEGRKLSEETTETVHERARRVIQLEFEAGADLERLRRSLTGERGLEASIEGSRLTLHLPTDDPRAVLAELLADPGTPQPRTIRYGELSLAELYRELYGVEAC